MKINGFDISEYMAKKHRKNKKNKKRSLLKKYRLLILNNETFEEQINFKISPLNVVIILGVSALLTVIFTTLLIAFTPLKEYIPGQSSTELRKEATALIYKTDSLENVLNQNEVYFKSIQRVLVGDTITEEKQKDTIKTENIPEGKVDFSPSEEDLKLRKEVEQKEKYNVLNPALDKSDYKLFSPARGSITQNYDPKHQHFGVDLSLSEKTPIKATADGTVIFSEWSAETGYVVILEHRHGLISVYKHNSSLTKQQGQHVKEGEVIAMSGNTGELTTGPHLHFELWKNGNPVDPTEFLEFE